MDNREMNSYTDNQVAAMATNAIETLGILFAADTDKIVDLLTGYLWSEEEASLIKASDGKHDCMEMFNRALENEQR